MKAHTISAIGKSTEVRCSSVIVGDCSLKLLRQEYFLSKQKEFLTFLARQWAREQLLVLALRMEGRQLDNLLLTLKSVSQQIQRENEQRDERLVHFNI